MVFLWVRPKYGSLSLGKYKKISARYCGPYPIMQKINDQAYKLMLPPHVKVHDVFHINLLKKYVPDDNHILGDETLLVSKDSAFDITPERILQTRERILHNRSINKHLIKWMGYL